VQSEREIYGLDLAGLQELFGKAYTATLRHAWAEYLHIPYEVLIEPGTTVVEQDELWASLTVEVTTIVDHTCIACDREMSLTIREAIARRGAISTTARQLLALLEGRGMELTASRMLHHLPPADFNPKQPPAGFQIRDLGEEDSDALQALKVEVPPSDAAAAFVEIGHPRVAGCWKGRKLVAVASLLDWQPLWDIGVLTHPGFRMRGLGTAVVGHLCSWVLRRGGVPVYRARRSNLASRHLAVNIGFVHCFMGETLTAVSR